MKSLCCFFLLSLLFWGQSSIAATCNQACLAYSDCSDSTCPVCTGTCVGCSALGDSSSCGNVGSGASISCSWSGGTCSVVAPEIPGKLFPFVFLLSMGLIARIAKKRCLLNRLYS